MTKAFCLSDFSYKKIAIPATDKVSASADDGALIRSGASARPGIFFVMPFSLGVSSMSSRKTSITCSLGLVTSAALLGFWTGSTVKPTSAVKVNRYRFSDGRIIGELGSYVIESHTLAETPEGSSRRITLALYLRFNSSGKTAKPSGGG